MEKTLKDVNKNIGVNKNQSDTKSQLSKAINTGNDIKDKMVYVTEGHTILFSKGYKNK